MECERCGIPYPVSELTPQKTEVSPLLRVCFNCFDQTDNNYREEIIAKILQQNSKEEAQDRRWDPQLWFTSADSEN